MSTQVYNSTGGGLKGLFPDPIQAQRNPVSTDIVSPTGEAYQISQTWQNVLTSELFIYLGGGNWEPLVTVNGVLINLLPDTGTTPVVPSAGAITIAGGSGIQTVGGTNSLTINAIGDGTTVTTVTTNTSMAVNHTYVTNKSSTAASMLLPATAAEGSVVRVIGLNSTGWIITQASGQTIHMNSVSTTTGATGSLASTAQYNSVTLMCTVSNTDWTVIASEGTLTVT